MNSKNDYPLQIERIHAPSVDEFNRLYAEPGKPVLITGVVSNWEACKLWNSQYLCSVAGEREVPVKRMSNGSYLDARTEMIRLKDYLHVASKEQNGDELLYLSEQPVEKILPEIVEDYTVPEYINTKEKLAVCYLGSHVYSQMHFHPLGKALLCVVSGRKNVKLYAPDQTPFLYQKYNFSKIDSDPVDLEKYPLYGKAKYYECEVKSGEMLFFPIYWWHGVETEEFTSAVVFFWNDSRKVRWLPPSGIPWYTPLIFEVAPWYFKTKKIFNGIFGIF